MSPDPRQTGEMTFLDHLDELRKVLLQSAVAALAGGVAGWWLAPRVLEDVIARTVQRVIVLSPVEAFNERFKLALILGLLLTLPFLVWKIWSFVVPGLFRRERLLVLPMVLGSIVLFAFGAWAAYVYLVPLAISVLTGFMTPSMKAEIRIGSLLGFVYNMAFMCGLVCQLPLVLMTLTAIGLVTPGYLLRQWRMALVVVFFLTAVVTPGDVVTAQLIMGGPLVGLYLLSVGLSWLVAKRRREGEALEEAKGA